MLLCCTGAPRPSALIYVVRDPRGAILANYNRMGSFLPKDFYKLSSGRKKRAAKRHAGARAAKRE
eukprot:6379516-Ditylum_brightwellii.AAC.1